MEKSIEEIIRLLTTPIRDFSVMDMIGATLLVILVVSFAMFVINTLDILIKFWFGEKR